MPTPNPAASSPPPKRRTTSTPTRTLARQIVEAIQSKKGQDVVVIDVHHVSGVTDYYILATGGSDIQVRAIADAVREQIKEATGERPWKKEGLDVLQWVVLDYVDVVVHIFDAERRAFYDLERLWGDAPTEHVADDATEVELLREDAA